MAETSEAGKLGMWQGPAAHMHSSQLGASVQHGEYLARIEQALFVKGAFEPLLLVEIDLVEHRGHEIALFHADAMLAGEHAPHGNAKLQDLGSEFLGCLELAGLIGVVEDQGMKIAVSGMK